MASYMIFILHIYTDVFLESPDSKILDGWSERFRELTMFLYQKSGQTILASCNVPKKGCRYIFIYIDIYVSRFTYLDSDTTFLMFSVFPLHEVVNFAIVFANPRGQWKGNICCLSHLFVSWFWQACLRVTANKTHKISIKIPDKIYGTQSCPGKMVCCLRDCFEMLISIWIMFFGVKAQLLQNTFLVKFLISIFIRFNLQVCVFSPQATSWFSWVQKPSFHHPNAAKVEPSTGSDCEQNEIPEAWSELMRTRMSDDANSSFAGICLMNGPNDDKAHQILSPKGKVYGNVL